jgi:hypothetical protein
MHFFERQILQKIFGPVNIDNVWRIRNNMQIDKLIEGVDIVTFINPLNAELNPFCHLLALLGAHHFLHVSRIRVKAQRIKWLRHIQRMDQARPTRKLLDSKPMETRPVGKPRQR